MISELEQSVGLGNLFVLDSNMVGLEKLGYICAALQNFGSKMYKIDMSSIKLGIGRLEELGKLIDKTRVIVVSDVRKEIRNFSSAMKNGIRTIRVNGSSICLNGAERQKLEALEDYTAKLDKLRLKLFNLDPREKDFSREEVFKVDRHSLEYEKVLKTADEKLMSILYSKGKATRNGKAHLTDAVIFSVAYLLSQEYTTCILSNDMDLTALAVTFEPGTRIDMSEDHKVTRAFHPLSGYSIIVYNPQDRTNNLKFD